MLRNTSDPSLPNDGEWRGLLPVSALGHGIGVLGHNRCLTPYWTSRSTPAAGEELLKIGATQ